MRKPLTFGIPVAGCAVALAVLPASPAAAVETAPARPQVVTGSANLTSGQVVPGRGDRNGSGRFSYRIDDQRLCYRLTVRVSQRPTAAHIHRGRRGRAAPPVIRLTTPPRNGIVSACVRAVPNDRDTRNRLSRRELNQISRNPSAFYVQVHTTRYPDGAIRGQLRG